MADRPRLPDWIGRMGVTWMSRAISTLLIATTIVCAWWGHGKGSPPYALARHTHDASRCAGAAGAAPHWPPRPPGVSAHRDAVRCHRQRGLCHGRAPHRAVYHARGQSRWQDGREPALLHAGPVDD